MINIFEIPATDQSIYFLTQVFGLVGTVLPTNASAPMILGVMFSRFNAVILTVAVLIIVYVAVVGVMKTAHEGEMLGKNWNSLWVPIRMVVGVAALVPSASGYSAVQIVIMWVIVQGIGAADSIWTTVLKYTETMGSPLARISIPTTGMSNNVQTLFQSLTCQASAKAAYANPLGSDATDGGYYCADHKTGDPFCSMGDDSSGILNIAGTQTSLKTETTTTLQNNVPILMTSINVNYPIGPGGACGKMSYCDTNSFCTDNTSIAGQIKCNACKAQKDALQAIVTTLGGIAKTFIDIDYQYRVFMSSASGTQPPSFVGSYCSASGIPTSQCCRSLIALPPMFTQYLRNQRVCSIPFNWTAGNRNNAVPDAVTNLYWLYGVKPNLGEINFVSASVNNYTASLAAAVQQVIQNVVASTKLTDEILVEAQARGWIYAGAYYYNLANRDNKNVDASMPPISVVGVDPSIDPNNLLYTYRNNFQAAGKLTSYVSVQGQSGSFAVNVAPQLSDLSKLSDGLTSSAGDIMDVFTNDLTGGSSTSTDIVLNPLQKLQHLGYILLIVAQLLFALILSVIPLITLFGYLNIFALGTGADNPVGPTVTTLSIIFAPLFALFMGALFTFGALLSIYTPLIPYIIFTMGAISWFLLVIEAMVAGPLVALGILSPAAHHEILGKAEPALMLIFGIFLRPGLMIFGMMAAMLLAGVVVTMINVAFKSVMGSINQSPGLVEILLFLGAYVGLVLAALNKCFSLIHVIPDRVVRWIGGHPEETGGAAGEGTQGAKGGVQATGGAMQKGGGQAVSKAQQADKGWKAQKVAKNEADEKKQAQIKKDNQSDSQDNKSEGEDQDKQ